jgi:MobA/MobL family
MLRLRGKGTLDAMASYFLLVKTFSRGKGSSATKAAAYRSGERIRDERSGAVHDYTDRTDVAHAEIVLPAEYAGHTDMEWALNRSVLWNAVQQSGRQWNARLAREVLVHVPPEMTRAQRVALVRRLSHELADQYHSAVDFAVHEPRPQADQRHHHAHILMTSRQVGPAGIGARTTLELSGTERHDRGLGPSREDLLWLRERWAQISNEALREAGLTARIDHRSYKEQGIDREPKPLLPQSIVYSERGSGRSNPAGDEIRARYRERVEARSKGPEELARVIQRQREKGRERVIQAAERRQLKTKIPTGAMTREQLKAKRRQYNKAHAAEIRRKQRERRRVNREEVNRKQREYAQRRKAERLAAKHSPGNEQQQPGAKTAVARIAEASPISPHSHSPTLNAEESVKNWLAYRKNQKQLSAAESPNEWLAFRASQAPIETKSPTIEMKNGDDEESKATSHRCKNDLTL